SVTTPTFGAQQWRRGKHAGQQRYYPRCRSGPHQAAAEPGVARGNRVLERIFLRQLHAGVAKPRAHRDGVLPGAERPHAGRKRDQCDSAARRVPPQGPQGADAVEADRFQGVAGVPADG
ncbi:unnamed protein product, partial [Amoebophrya sp. A120]